MLILMLITAVSSRKAPTSLYLDLDQLDRILDYFAASSTSGSMLKWKYLAQDTIYQIISACSINTHHGTSIVLSLQKADGFCYSVWACGMLTKELPQNSMMLEDKNSRLFVRPIGSRTSKNGRIYNSYQLLRC